jgi:hypothetical protein
MNTTGPVEMKIEVAFEHLLCRTGVRLVVHPWYPGVVLPPQLHDLPHVMLEYELDPVVPIPDLEVTAAGVRATLSFGREPFATFIPWLAVLAMGPMHAERIESPAKRRGLRAV